MNRTALAALALTVSTTACSFFSEKPAATVEENASGLTGFNVPGDNGPKATEVQTGAYRARIVSVLELDEDRTDIYEGAEFEAEVTHVPGIRGGYLINDHIEFSGYEGRITGEAGEEQGDPDADCYAVTDITAQGRARDTSRFQVLIQETVVVKGDGCDESFLGPARVEENLYKVRFVSQG